MRALLQGSFPPAFRAAGAASLKKRELSCVLSSSLLAGTSYLATTSGLPPLLKSIESSSTSRLSIFEFLGSDRVEELARKVEELARTRHLSCLICAWRCSRPHRTPLFLVLVGEVICGSTLAPGHRTLSGVSMVQSPAPSQMVFPNALTNGQTIRTEDKIRIYPHEQLLYIG